MAGLLWFVILMSLLQPELTVTPPVITEHESVTLKCETRTSMFVTECYFFNTLSGKPISPLSSTCQLTLTGTELLMTYEKSSAEVKVKCYYTVKTGDLKEFSTFSNTFSVTIQMTLLQPELTVTPPVITEHESVTLNCQTGTSMFVTECYFFNTLSGKRVSPVSSSCQLTLTGTELLMTNEKSSAEVKVKCYYTVKTGDLKDFSPFSDSVTIQMIPLQPELTVTPLVITEHESVTLNCQTRTSMFVTECYFIHTLSGKLVSPLNSSCQLTLTGTELLMTNETSSAEVKVKCYYTVKNGDSKSPSPHSASSSVIIQSAAEDNKSKTELTTSISEKETQSPVGGGDKETVTATINLSTKGSNLTPGDNTTETVTATINLSTKGSVKTAVETLVSRDNITEIMMPLIGAAVTVILLGFALLSSQSRTALLQPELTVTPLVITEHESVTLNCQTRTSMFVTECYFFNTLSGKHVSPLDSSCQLTLTGTELLMTNERSSAEVKVKCYYTVKNGDLKELSPFSDTSSVIIQTLLQPNLTVTPLVITEHELVTLNCQTRTSMFVTECYFIDTLSKKLVIPVSSSCQLTLTGTELLMTNEKSSAEVKVKCYYIVKNGDLTSPSPHSASSSVIIQRAAEDNKSKTELTTSISKKETQSPVGGGDKETVTATINLSTKGSNLTPGDNTTETVTATINLSTKGSVNTAVETLVSRDNITALLQPELTVTPPVITEHESVTLKCETRTSMFVTECYFFNTLSGKPISPLSSSCQLTLTGTELLMTNETSSAEVKVQCYYTLKNGDLKDFSPFSDTFSVIIQTLLQPNLTVTPLVITEHELVTLKCETPSSMFVTECFFSDTLSGKLVKPLSSSCQLTLMGTELLMTNQKSSAEVKVKCYYTVKTGDLKSPSPHSASSSVIIQRAAENDKSKTELTTSISKKETQSPVGGGDEGFGIWKLGVVVTAFGLTAGAILMGMTLLCIRRRTGSEKLKGQEFQSEDMTYHYYATVSEVPAASALENMVYSTVQAH
ncbi:hypothetical protein PAMA_010595 [Pampus argenteus]